MKHLPVKQFIVDILGSLYICTHGINHLNQLLQLLLQSLSCQHTMNRLFSS